MLLLAVAVAVPCSWFMAEIGAAKRQHEIVEAARQLGCGYLYDFNLGAYGDVELYSGIRPGTTRWHERLGDELLPQLRRGLSSVRCRDAAAGRIAHATQALCQ